MSRAFSIRMKKKKYPGIGICIYCLKPYPPEQLTDEHIIPDALKGTLIFKKSVCIPCKEVTGVQEREVLKLELLIPRVLLELKPPSIKHRLPKFSFTANIGDTNAVFDTDIPREDYPQIISSVMIEPPGLLLGKNIDGISRMALQYINLHSSKNPPKQQQYATRHSHLAGAIQHMVAKIAYSYAIAEKGLDYFDSTEIRKILLDDSDELFNYVGSAPPEDSGKSQDLHWLSFFEEKGYFVCRVQLFGSIGMHPHYVVLGKRVTTSFDSQNAIKL
ncbi:HNH endonuclease [Methylophilus sp. Leaf414]|uniref:HNH endonuclease n=1 Tax=Methylophilus sp. Leaf414 TaxID=1736371 RepID=UPI0006FF165F|nr:HNH endonuclease [Methylophilus sp. Leaf414]KQT37651.1 hypothetical protein ASG24_01250 [Methylophilus sp. Leaf414]